MSSRRSDRLSKLKFCGPGGTLPYTLLSAASGALLPFISTYDARSLRATCREALHVVSQFPFEEPGYWSEADHAWHAGTPVGVEGLPMSTCLSRWRACFPNARGLNLSSAHFEESDVATYLPGIRSLDMSGCLHVRDAYFAHLGSLERLIMNGLDQLCLTDAFSSHLPHLTFLVAGGCPQLTSLAFKPLRRLQTLVLWQNSEEHFGDAALAPLAGSIRTLVLGNMAQLTITDAGFAHLAGVQRLLMWGCSQPTLTDAAFLQLGGLHTLDISGCSQGTFTDELFAPLGAALRDLTMDGCTQFTDEVFKHLGSLHSLSICDCSQLTGSGLHHLTRLQKLQLKGCSPALRKAAKA